MILKNFVKHFSSTIRGLHLTGDLRSMNSKQFLYATQKHNENITAKTTTNILFNLLKNQKGKTKFVKNKKTVKSGYKKAIVTLKKGQSIDLATGI